MADVRRTIELVFGAVDQTSSVLDRMGTSVEGFSDRLESTTRPIADFTTNLLKIEGAVVAVAAALGGIAIAKAAEFQSATLELQRVLGEGEGDIGDFQQAAVDLSDQFGTSASEVLRSTANFRQAGFTAQEALGLVETSIAAVATTELDSVQATETFIRLLAGFNAPASDAARALDIVNAVSAEFATDVPKLTEAMARASGVAGTLGFSMEELAALATPIISVFQSGEIAGTALATSLQRLLSDSKPVVDALDSLGISQEDVNGKLRSAKDILRDVQIAFQGLDDAQQVQLASQLVGIEQASKLLPIFTDLAKTTAILDVATNSAGATQKELALAMESTELQATRMRESFNNAAIAVGERLRPEFTNLLASLGTLGTTIRTAVEDGKFDSLFQIINDGFATIGQAVEEFAQSLPAALDLVDFQPLLDAITEVAGGIDSALEFDPSKPQDLARLIQLAVDAIAGLVNVTGGVITGLSPLFAGFNTLLGIFADLDPQTQSLIGQFLGVSTALNIVAPLLTTAAGGLGLLQTALGARQGLVALLGGFAANLTTIGSLLIGNAGLVGLVGGASFGIASWALEQTGLNDKLAGWIDGIRRANSDLPELQRQLEQAQKKSQEHREELARLAQENASLTPDLRENTALFEEWSRVAESLGGSLKITKDGLAEVVFETDKTATSMRQVFDPIKAAREELEKIGVQSAELADKGFTILAQEGTQLGGVFTNITPEASALIKETKDLTQSEKEAAEETAKLAEESRQLDLEFEKLRSGEREVLLTVAGDIRVAEIEAQAQQVVAAFESITTSVEATTELIGGLAGIFAGADSQLVRSKIEKILEKELQLQEEQLDTQKELIDAQIDYLRAAAKQLASGEAQIQIEANGLEPEIEAFMFKIVEKIRIKANSQGQSYLLGIPSVT